MKDRGTIKWSAMMLPEHKKLLEKMYEEQEWVEKPILNQDKFEEINIVLLLALRENKLVRIKFYQDHIFRAAEGIITKYISSEGKLKITDKLDKIVFLHLDQIIDAEIV